MSLSKTALSVSESITLFLNAKAKQMKDNGEAVIHLGGGEPKSKAPEESVGYAEKILRSREVRYSPSGGLPELKDAVIDYTKRYYKYDVERGNIIISAGAKQAIMTALKAILNVGDEVIIPVPYWVSYPEMIKLCQGVPVYVHPEDNSYIADVKAIENSVTDKTKAIILNSPSNPSGILYPEEQIREIVEYCEDRKINLIMDDIYHRLLFDGKEAPSCFSFAKHLDGDSRLIVINGISKVYAMTGFRIGWAIANKTLIKVMTNIQGHETSGASTVSQYAAIGALKSDQSSVEELTTTLEKNRNILMTELSKIKDVYAPKPDGTFYCFADFSAYTDDAVKLAEYILEKVKVVLVPGNQFGMNTHMRISTCGSEEDIIEGIRRIRWALDDSMTEPIKIGNEMIEK
jgi:aspartate aminotransferase